MNTQTDAVVETQSFEDKLLYIETPFDPAGDVRNPYLDYARAREATPVLIDERFGPDTPLVYLYRQADIVAAMLDNEVYSSRIIHNLFATTMGEFLLVGEDEPSHGAFRRVLAPALRPKVVARWEHALIHRVADELIDAIVSRGQCDLVKDFCFAYPAKVVARIIGVPEDNFAQFQHWAIDIVGAAADPEAAIEAGRQMRAYLADFIADRRKTPTDDMISELVHAEMDGERLSEEVIYSFLLLLMPAGIETTYRSLGSLLFNLLTRPDQLEAVRRDRSLVPKAIEENLRTDPPVQFPPRITTRETELGGVTIPEGSVVIPLLGAANRDPAFIDNPEEFDIHRSIVKHVTFGNGVHTCMGLHLAKLEIGIALNKLLDRLPGLRFDTGKAREIDAHIRGKSFRSPTAIPVRWDI